MAFLGILGELTRAEIGCVVAGILCNRNHGLLTGPAASVTRDCRRRGSRRTARTSHTCAAICTLITDMFGHSLCLVASLVHQVLMMQVLCLGAYFFNARWKLLFQWPLPLHWVGNTQSSSQRGDGEWRIQ